MNVQTDIWETICFGVNHDRLDKQYDSWMNTQVKTVLD
jgi:hypothetical protein